MWKEKMFSYQMILNHSPLQKILEAKLESADNVNY